MVQQHTPGIAPARVRAARMCVSNQQVRNANAGPAGFGANAGAWPDSVEMPLAQDGSRNRHMRALKRRLAWLFLLAVPSLAGCRGDPGSAKDGSAALVVGDQRGGVRALLQAAGELDHVPYKIEWALFPAASPLLEALGSGAIDVGGVGSAPFAFAYASGAPIKVVFAYRQIDGKGGRASAIIVRANSPLHSIRDLRGRKLATVRGSAGQNLALRLLEDAGLKASDIEWVYLNNGEAKSALASGAIDAWATWGSYVGIALLEDKERALADATHLDGEAGFYAANDKAIAEKHAQLLDFLVRISQARAWVLSHQEEYAKVLAQETGIPLDVARFTAREYKYGAIPVSDDLQRDLRHIFERYRRAGLMQTVPELGGAFDTSFNAAVGVGGEQRGNGPTSTAKSALPVGK